MITASALYNMTQVGRTKEFMRRADHAAIYLMIAGTYTPFAVERLAGAAGIAIGVSVWLAADLGSCCHCFMRAVSRRSKSRSIW